MFIIQNKVYKIWFSFKRLWYESTKSVMLRVCLKLRNKNFSSDRSEWLFWRSLSNMWYGGLTFSDARAHGNLECPWHWNGFSYFISVCSLVVGTGHFITNVLCLRQFLILAFLNTTVSKSVFLQSCGRVMDWQPSVDSVTRRKVYFLDCKIKRFEI